MLSVRKILTTAVLILAAARLSAQSYDTYALSRFKAAEFYRTGLSFYLNGGLNGSGSDGKQTSSSDQGWYSYASNGQSDNSNKSQRFNAEMLHTLDCRQGKYDYSGSFRSRISLGADLRDGNSSGRGDGAGYFQNQNNDSKSNNSGYYQRYDLSYASQLYIDQFFATVTPTASYAKENTDNDNQNNSSNGYITNQNDSISIAKNSLSDESQDGTDWQEEYSYDLPFSFGYGRIENVTDARQTVYILDELQNSGYLTERLSDEAVDRLATEINHIKNQRVLDSREKAKYQLAALDSVLYASGKLKERNVGYFNIINDNWNYGANQNRLHGWSAGVKAGYSKNSRLRRINSEKISDEYETRDTILFDQDTVAVYNNHSNSFSSSQIRASYDADSYTLGCFGRLQQQIDLYSQYGISLSVNHRWSKQENDEERYYFQRQFEQDSLQIMEYDNKTNISYDIKTLSAELSVGYDYFPNTRTSISNSVTAFYSKSKEDQTATSMSGYQGYYGITTDQISFTWNSSISYYFSPRLSASLNGYLRYDQNERDFDMSNEYSDYIRNEWSDSDYFQYSLSVGMNYTLY